VNDLIRSLSASVIGLLFGQHLIFVNPLNFDIDTLEHGIGWSQFWAKFPSLSCVCKWRDLNYRI
jgi:hypothetical protein